MAQVAGTAALTGAVTDPSGAIVVGADVTVTNLATGAKRSATTDSTGKYLISQVQPGDYRVDVTATGFKTAARPRVELPIGITSTMDVLLELGELAEVVEVQAFTAGVNTNDASMGAPLTGAEIRALPSLDLNPAGLLSLQAGVAFVPSAADTPGGYGGVSDFDGRSGAVNGARSDQTNITLDGVDCNDPISGYAFTCVLRATQGSLAEFRTTTTNYGAEAGGRSGAAQVQLITISGENSLHGSGYYAHRNERLNANDFFLNKSGVDEPPFRRHIYGGALGGPIMKNRLFFFGNVERMEESLFKSAVRSVPSLSFRDGVMIYRLRRSGWICAVPDLADQRDRGQRNRLHGSRGQLRSQPGTDCGYRSPRSWAKRGAASGTWKQYPTDINDSSVGDGVNVVGHRFAAPIDNLFNTYIGKLNFNAGSNHALFVRGTLQDDTVAQEPAFLGGDPIRTTETGNRGMAAGHTWVVNSSLVNNFRYGYTRIKLDNVGVRNAEYSNVRFIDELNGFDQTASSLIRSTPTNHFRDDLTWTRGAHTFSMGGEARFVRNDRSSDALAFHGFTVNPSWLADGGRSIEPGQENCDRPGCFAVPASAGVNFRDRLTLMLGPIYAGGCLLQLQRTRRDPGFGRDRAATLCRQRIRGLLPGSVAHSPVPDPESRAAVHECHSAVGDKRQPGHSCSREFQSQRELRGVVPVPGSDDAGGASDGRLRLDRNATRWSGQRRPAVLRPRQQQLLAAHRCRLGAGRRQVGDSRRVFPGVRPDGHGAGEFLRRGGSFWPVHEHLQPTWRMRHRRNRRRRALRPVERPFRYGWRGK